MQNKLKQHNAKRGDLIRLLRKIHGWLGLWGALLGLLFGISGFFLNHRGVLKIPAVQMESSEIQLEAPQPQPSSTKELAQLIQRSLNIHHDPVPDKPLKDNPMNTMGPSRRFLGNDIKQPEHWQVVFQLPQAKIQAEYVAGNQFATVKREDANIWGFITRMHKGTGASPAWVLLADTLAGAMVMLSITGVLLWTKLRGSRLVMSGLIGGSMVLTIWVTMKMM